MSNYKLKFKLKQHTPIIHFQHDQHGATLRATELKPKLDRFLIEKLKLTRSITENGKEKEVPKNEYKDWFINEGKNHVALDYKVKIISDIISKRIDLQETNKDGTPKTKFNKSSKRREIVTKSFPLFFAMMGDEWEKNKKMFSFNENTIVIFTSLNTDLLAEIKNSFSLFILITNFGTRQSKGFGSYFIDENDENYISPIEVIRKCKINFWKISFSIEKERDVKVVNSYDEYQVYAKVFDKINDFYKAIRGGINLSFLNPPFYLKSLLYVYVTQNPNITWAKREIKEFHFSNFRTDHNHLHPIGNSITPFLYRDLLGLSTKEEWLMPYGDSITKEDLQQDSDGNHCSDEMIERYKSPITFIPIQDSKDENKFTVYLWAKNIEPKILNRKFKIDSKSKVGQEISTPASFEIYKYLDFLTTVNLSAIVDKEMHGHWYFKKLTSLFSSLKKIKLL